LAYFPSDPVALEELGTAAEHAGVGFMERAITEWIGTQTRCPSPAEMRAAVAAAKDRVESSGSRCSRCDGTAWVTAFRLVTFWENTFRIRRSESLDHMTFEAIQTARGEIGKNQDIIGVAKPCPVCRVGVAA
jgi:hypothetical protein